MSILHLLMFLVYNTLSESAIVDLLKNEVPVADAGTTIYIKKGTRDTITLNGAASYDPDNGPNPLQYYWKYFKHEKNRLREFNLSSYNVSQQVVRHVSIKDLELGTYSFILYVADGQALSWDILNVTILSHYCKQ